MFPNLSQFSGHFSPLVSEHIMDDSYTTCSSGTVNYHQLKVYTDGVR